MASLGDTRLPLFRHSLGRLAGSQSAFGTKGAHLEDLVKIVNGFSALIAY
jgi:hypothetical protein